MSSPITSSTLSSVNGATAHSIPSDPGKKPKSSETSLSSDSSLSSMALADRAQKKSEKPEMKEEQKAEKSKANETRQTSSSQYFQELPEGEFFKRFPYNNKKLALDAHTDEYQISGKTPVLASAVGDCVVLFGKMEGEIFVYHAATSTTKEDILAEFEEMFLDPPDTQCDLFTIGGNGSPESIALLEEMKKAILKYFGANGKILEHFVNPCGETNKTHLSAALCMDGKLFFCRHNVEVE